MKLSELAAQPKTKNISKVFESYFDQNVNFDSLKGRNARTMLSKVRRLVAEHRSSHSFHSSERNPAYLKLVMMEQALTQRVVEDEVIALNVNDPKVKAIQQKLKNKQVLSPDEQKIANGLASTAMQQEDNTGNFLKESEVQQAQVVLAAQDMVDRMQKMLEDTTEMQFKELPALVDSIKNQVGQDQAAQFNTDASAALAGLVQNLQGAKQQLEAALGVVTGQAPVAGVEPGAEIGADLGAEMGADAGADLGAEAGAELGAEDDLDAAADIEALGGKSLGRERR